ncbi:hypothetical protein [Phyllobacterium sp. SB3]|uniref:hypothetical protein n=1 Tax=Phyllobacterium sp. SB3 TaxID=3156073 RepID=UPI0032AF4BD5
MSATWSEFRETTIEPRSGHNGIRNAIRPSIFFNLDDMGFGVSGWRSVNISASMALADEGDFL